MKSKAGFGTENQDKSFPIVVIGASAGGLPALEKFVSALPNVFGFALIFMQHLSAQHKNLLPELLRSRIAGFSIEEINDGADLVPGKLYLCPPAREVRVENNTFRMATRSKLNMHQPIDELLLSLSANLGERTIAVILSGAGTDGTRGVQAVRNAGGTVFVQDPATAEYPYMPLSAIKTGQIDGVLAPDDIAREILKYHRSGIVSVVAEESISPVDLDSLFELIDKQTGHHFNHYKKSVITRRVSRRMHLQGVSTMEAYLELLVRKDSETAQLALDLMIGVTSFFRDPLAWKALHLEATRKLVAEEDNSPIRVWTPACATGEEAYSIAMLLRHDLSLSGKNREIQVFATDVNDLALERAREGVYPATIAVDLPPDYLKEFFTPVDDRLSLVVNKDIRQQIVFAKHDLLADPPFSRLDIVICRNLLIYLEADAQDKCISLFNYALKKNGYLFLGNAESPGRNSPLFVSLSHKKCRIYRKAYVKPHTRIPLSMSFASERSATLLKQKYAVDHSPSITEFIQEALLEKHAPAAVAINSNYDILYHNGPTYRYLRQPRGTPTRNFLELLPERLKRRVRGALYSASQENKPVNIRTSITDESEQHKKLVSISVLKLRDNLFLITFQEKGGFVNEVNILPLEAVNIEETAIHQLENELASTRDDLQSHIEQLKSLNEELESSNEELQAANEELETSREELQSLNEELTTVNAQLQAKIEEQEETNNDLNNFLTSTNIPTVFLDLELKVKRFTPAMSRLVTLIPADVGRPIMDMSQVNLGPDFITDARSVQISLAQIRKELPINGAWYIRTTLPYRTIDNRIEGVVITYNEITEMKRVEDELRQAKEYLEVRVQERTQDLQQTNRALQKEIAERWRAEEAAKSERQRLFAVLETLPVYVVLLTRDYHVPFANRFFRERFGESGGKRCFEYLFNRSEPCEVCETYSVMKTGAPHHWEWIGPDDHVYDIYDFPFTDSDGSSLIMEMGIDITERKKAEAALLEMNETLEQRVAQRTAELQKVTEREHFLADVLENAETPFSVSALDGSLIFFNRAFAELTGYTREELENNGAIWTTELTPPEWREQETVALDKIGQTEKFVRYEKEYLRKDSTRVSVEIFVEAVSDDIGSIRYYYSFLRDITERKRIEATLADSRQRLSAIVDSIADGFFAMDREWRITHVNDVALKHFGRTREQMVGQMFFDAFPESRGTAFEIEYVRAMESNEPVHFEVASIISDKIIEVHAYPGQENITILFRDVTERAQAENVRRHLASFPELNPNPVMEVNASGELIYCNPAGYKILEDLRMAREDWRALLPGDLNAVLGDWDKNTPAIFDREVTVKNRTFGETIQLVPEFNVARMYAREVTVRKQAEDRAIRLARLYSMLSKVNEMIVRTHDVDSLYAEVCRIVAEEGGFHLVWIGLASQEQVIPVASCGPATDYLGKIKVEIQGKLGKGPTGTCIRENCSVVNNDFAINPATIPWRDAALNSGFHSSAAFPLRCQGKAVGAFTLYAAEPDAFDAEQVDLFESLSADISYALDAFEQERLRIRSEEELIKAKKEWERTFASVPDMIAILDKEFRILQVNETMAQRLRIKAEECIGIPCYKAVHGLSAPPVFCPHMQTIKDHKQHIEEIHENRLGGDFEVSTTPIYDDHGQITGSVHVLHDITENKRAAAALHRSLERFALLAGTAGELLQTADPQRIVESLATRVMEYLDCQAFFNYIVDDEAGKLHLNAYTGIPENEGAKIEWLDYGVAVCGCAARDNCRVVAEHIHTTPDERTELVKSYGIKAYAAHPIQGPGGKILGTLSFGAKNRETFSDDDLSLMWAIADQIAMAIVRMKAEEALKIARDELELRVQERTVQLSEAYETLAAEVEERKKAEEQLRQSHKMEAIGTLAGGIAHDFNNILASVIGFTEMAVEDLPDRPEVVKNLQNVLKSSARARDLVRQILTFSRKTDQMRGPVPLTSIIKETIQLLRASIPTTVKIKLNLHATSDMVFASPIELQQVLMNLAGNAALAMQKKGGQLEISLDDIDIQSDSSLIHPDLAQGEYVQLVVKDTGVGMTPEIMKRIFEPFFTTRGVGQGTGMGLAMVYGIIRDLSGVITVESEPGIGSIFRIIIPKVMAETQEEPILTHKTPLGKESILFIDDENLLAEWGKQVLSRLGYRATSMTDSKKALKTFKANPSRFDLVITDQTMPGLTGVQLAVEFMKIRPDIPVILCTGHSDIVTSEDAREMGIREYIIKPINKSELAEAIRRVLDNTDKKDQ